MRMRIVKMTMLDVVKGIVIVLLIAKFIDEFGHDLGFSGSAEAI